MTARHAVFGNPPGHSKSPFIHARFAAECGQDPTHEKIEAPIDGFEVARGCFIAEGGSGCNVTAPFELEAFRLATGETPEAAMAGATNTLRFPEGGIEAHNTDGVGLLADVERLLGSQLHGKRVSMPGAGGAARPRLRAGVAAKGAGEAASAMARWRGRQVRIGGASGSSVVGGAVAGGPRRPMPGCTG